MSKFSYDDLPWEVASQLQCLDLELEEGDITQKGYEKKRNQILATYQDVIEETSQSLNSPLLKKSSSSIKNEIQVNDTEQENSNTADAFLDLGPEPSAADVTDFLDFLPSPTHSPVNHDNKGAALMMENHKNFVQNKHNDETISNNQPSVPYSQPLPPPPPPPPPPSHILANHAPMNNIQPSRPYAPINNYRPAQNYMNRPAFDPRMGNFRPMYGNAYPSGRPPIRPTPPLLPSSNTQMNPMYRPQQSQNGYGYRPPSISLHSGGPSTPTHLLPSFSQQHSRSPSMDSKYDHSAFNMGYSQNNTRQKSDLVTEPEYVGDWETSSISRKSNTGREPSIISASGGQIRHSMSANSAVSSIDSASMPISVFRSLSNSSMGRSRYRNSYMATSFKAIEPAPQPRLKLNDPIDQIFLSDLAGRQMTPLKGRPISFELYNADNKTILTDFKNLAEILRFRATKSKNKADNAFLLVDSRGKEPVMLSWEKLNARAEKIAQTLRNSSNMKTGDRVALIYRRSEILEFIPALFACFLAGIVAVPINAAEDLSELSFILAVANIHLILTTEHNHRAFTKDMQTKSIDLPFNVNWWKTNDMGTWYPPKNSSDYPPIHTPEAAYIEYAKASNGELKGVMISHASIMEQCAAFQAATTETIVNTTSNGNVEVKPNRNGHPSEVVVSYFEPRQQIGLVLSVLQSIYSGNTTIFCNGSIVDTPAIWIYVISKYKATMALADYMSMKQITNYFQSNTKEVKLHSKKVTPDLSALRYLIIDTSTIQPELNQYIADKLLRPLGNTDNPLEVVCPILSLPEHGGKILSMRDNLGPVVMEEHIEREEEITTEDGQQMTRPIMTTQSVLAPGGSRDIFTCLFDANALRMNKVLVVAAGAEAKKAENLNERERVRVESFGFCMPKATVAIVDPETGTLCPPDTFGEVWVDSPSIAGSFWALPKHTDAIFRARPIIMPSDSSYPEVYEGTFLRTGLSGTLIGGRLFILGTYEERIRQQSLGRDFGVEDTYYTNDLLNTLSKRTHIDQCTIFEIVVKNQHLPIVVCESNAPKNELTKIASEIDEALIEFHGLRAYAITFIKENGLPKQLIHGRRVIHPLMTKKLFLQGQLRTRYIKMDVDRTIFNLIENEEPSKSIWLSGAAYEKAIRTGAIMPHPQRQHTGMEQVHHVLDERTEYDISQFTNIIDILQWRTSQYPEETAYIVCTQSGSNTNTKTYSWRKLNYKSASISAYLTKKGLKRGAKVLIVTPFGIDYIFCIYACLAIGVVLVPFEPVDPQQQPQRVNEFSEQLIQVANELGISAILTNTGGDDILRNNAIKSAIKNKSSKNYKLPEIINVSKASKLYSLFGKESGFAVHPSWVNNSNRHSPTIILIQTSSDGLRYYTHLNHDTILNQCRTQKMTCQMRFQRGIVTTSLGTYEGLGFLHAAFCGVYVGCHTVLIPSEDFYLNPVLFFESLQRYKTKDAFVTNALIQFAMNRMNVNDCKHITLKGVQNLMLANDNRPKPLLYQHMTRYFARQRLDKESINTIYSHIGNPMITTRSYMLMEPIALFVDPYWLRQGIVRALNPEEEPYGILLSDSGIVPSNTMVAIVNPETRTVCPSNVIGEIWVSSDSNAKTFFGLDEAAHNQRFEATIVGNDPNVKYMRTGDFGFLWNVRRRVDNRMMQPMLEEGQCLYVLGPSSEAVIRNGLLHFPIDIELSIERCHPSIPPGGSVVFQHRNEIVVVASIKNNDHALSAIPLIVNAVLENHLFLIDAVVIVHPNNFPRSRFGDKLRKKTMAAFIEKKLPAICVKRITNQHETLNLPQYTQSQISLSDLNNNNDNSSVHTSPRSLLDFNSEIDRQLAAQQLVRQDTVNSHLIRSSSGSVIHTSI